MKELFRQWAGTAPSQCLSLGANGSSRRYYRLSCSSENSERTAIGCINDDIQENEAFFSYAQHLRSRGINVPEVYAISADRRTYLQQDLGDTTLYDILRHKKQKGGGFDRQMLLLYEQALSDLASIQIAGADADFSHAYPRPEFDRQSILWDLNYFKYHFLKLTHTPFHEQHLEDDFNTLADTLLSADTNYFLYRDFNPRNIMVGLNSELYYIDFQGGRRGAAQYDVASLLYSAKSDLPEPIRQHLLNHYLDSRQLEGDNRQQWIRHFWSYVLVRILQTLGAYGYRGLFEHKEYFLQSIPLALNNLQQLIQNHPQLLSQLPELRKVIEGIEYSPIVSSTSVSNAAPPSQTLTVSVCSFSYKNNLPTDPSGNGGGFIFDCRALPNPGRYTQYKNYTGKDLPVIQFLQQQQPVDQFLSHAFALVVQSVDKYLERNFTHLQVAFGCTGGQHRSVYCAEQLAKRLSEQYPSINICLRHIAQEPCENLK